MHSSTSLREFGYNFLGPICSEYFHTLMSVSEKVQPDFIGFLAREGYLFERIYQALLGRKLVREFPHVYLLASRTFLFRISIADPYSWQWSLVHKFYGSLEKLLMGRFGFTLGQIETVFSQSELSAKWLLPFEQETLEIHFSRKRHALNELVKSSQIAYLDYLNSLGINEGSIPLLSDVGYSGTIQKLLTRLLKINTYGVYFITTEQGQYRLEDNTATMFTTFKDKVKMGDGYTMLDRSLFLECLLTSPNGQFVDISKASEYSILPFEFSYGRQAFAQRNFHNLSAVFDGAIEAVCDAFSHKVRYSIEEIEMLYEQYATKRNMFPKAAWPLFDVDDAISGNGNVDPLRLFGL
jgi:hypothetical protein